jgi:hypothetical protein
MAAGLGFKTFTTGEVLTSADVNGYLMQGVLVFASEAARDAAITSPQEGQFAFTKDNNSLWYYDSAAWVASGATGDIEGVTAGTGISGGGTSGTVTITNSMATEIDAAGDLVVGTGADTFARLAVGANGTVLTAASGEATGLEWAAPAASGSMTLLTTTNLSGTTTSITSINQTYKDLMLRIRGLTVTTATFSLYVKVNGSTTNCDGIDFNGASQAALGGAALSPGNAGHSASSAINDLDFIFSAYAGTTYKKPYQYFGICKMASQVEPLGIGGLGGVNSNTAISSFDISNDSGGSFTAGIAEIWGIN